MTSHAAVTEPLDGRAADDLRFIRETMERAGSFTAVPGKGGVVVGMVALAAGHWAHRAQSREQWLLIWLAAAAWAGAIGAAAMFAKARSTRQPLLSRPGRKFLLSFLPSLLAGAVLTLHFARQGLYASLPGVWLMTYGVGVMAGGVFSAPVVPLMGGCFLGAGAVALFCPASWDDFILAVCFGFLHIVFGAVIARRYGG